MKRPQPTRSPRLPAASPPGALAALPRLRAAPALAALALALAALALALAALLAAALPSPAPAAAALTPPRPAVGQAHGFAPRQLVVKFAGHRQADLVRLPRGTGVVAAAAALRTNASVEYAEPNYLATASAAPTLATASAAPAPLVIPNDSGTLAYGAEAASAVGAWAFRQWNFLAPEAAAGLRLPTSPGGIDAPGAWRNLAAAGRPGAQGVMVAVLDTGVAYRNDGGIFLRSPDFSPKQFARGYDFVDADRLPLDQNGHGTHVAGTIGEETDNGIGLTGLAYNARLMPVRVLDAKGRGRASEIARGIRFATRHGAEVINMSFNFGCGKRVPEVDEALREAYARGVVTVASAGNLGSETCVSEPATGPRVIAVGGSTAGGCLGAYSLAGKAIDLLAPGGGRPVASCPSVSARPIYQVTLRRGSTSRFAIPNRYVGTSMAAAHVSAVAAMVLAAGTYRAPGLTAGGATAAKARVDGVAKRLRETARSLGLRRTQQGAGLIDAAAATAPRTP